MAPVAAAAPAAFVSTLLASQTAVAASPFAATGSAFAVASRDRLFSPNIIPGNIHANYDVAKDGRHFLMVRSVGNVSDLTVVVHWLEDAKRRLARRGE